MLLCADGFDNKAVAEEVGTSRQTVGKWRERFRTQGLMGLYDERRPGKPRSIEDDEVWCCCAGRSTPSLPTAARIRSMADTTAVEVHGSPRLESVQYPSPEALKLSTDPFFVEKVHDIVGLYLNPPDNAMVLCVDEKGQTLERTQPLLPLGLGYVEGVTHGSSRDHHPLRRPQRGHRPSAHPVQAKAPSEFLSFLKHIDANVPPDLDVHLVQLQHP